MIPRPRAWEARALPVELLPRALILWRRELRPPELPSRPASVTVDASDIALLDLGSNARPASVDHELCDFGQLLRRIAMVKFQNQQILCSAIDAWVRGVEQKNLAAVLLAPRLDLSDRAPDVVRLVGQIVGMSIDGVALSAIGIQRAQSLIRERELAGGLVCTTCRAPEDISFRRNAHRSALPVGTTRIGSRFECGGSCHSGRRTSRPPRERLPTRSCVSSDRPLSPWSVDRDDRTRAQPDPPRRSRRTDALKGTQR
jgi:hypothetical protein